MIENIPGEEAAKAIGKYIVLYMRGIGKYVGKLLSVDMKADDDSNGVMVYEVMSGPHKGKVREGSFVKGRPMDVYGEESLIKALLKK